nr:unnamed protein product [uncultured bacterium]
MDSIITTKQGGRPTKRPTVDEMCRLYSKHTASEIARMYSVTTATVRGWIAYYRRLQPALEVDTDVR